MARWKRRRGFARKTTRSRTHREEKCRVIRRLVSEALEQRILLTAVTSVNPLGNSHVAPIAADVTATFDENLNASTVTPQSFVAHSLQGGKVVAASVSAVANVAMLDPNADFFPGELVQATITSDVQSSGGNPTTPPRLAIPDSGTVRKCCV